MQNKPVFNVYIDNWTFRNLLLPYLLKVKIISRSDVAHDFFDLLIGTRGRRIFLYEMDKHMYKKFINELPHIHQRILVDNQFYSGLEICRLLESSLFDSILPLHIPHFVIGNEISSNNPFKGLKGLNIIDLSKENKEIKPKLFLNINLNFWFSDYKKNIDSNYIYIEDPYLLIKLYNLSDLNSFFDFIKYYQTLTLIISCKGRGLQIRDVFLTEFEIDELIERIKTCVKGLNKNCNISFSLNAKHDRYIVSNRRIYLIGNSFSMNRYDTTYLSSYSLLDAKKELFIN
jgi:hypothetical protein